MKVLLAVFGVQIKFNGAHLTLNNYVDNRDYLDTFHDFTNDVLKNVVQWEREKHPTLSLTCADGVLPSKKDRVVYGFFDAGRNGDRFKIKDYTDEKSDTTIIDPRHSSIREAFYFLSVPKGRTRGYLVLQVPEGQGIKHLVNHSIDIYMHKIGLHRYRVEISNLINDKVFHRMMDKGNFKEMVFTKYGIPSKMEDLKNNDTKVPLSIGTIKTVFQSPDLGKQFKLFARNIYVEKSKKKAEEGKSKIFVELMEDNYDEISMKIDLNGKQKTFHISQTGRTLPDLDVTEHIKRDSNGRLDIKDLIIQAKDLIADVSDHVSAADLK